MPDRTRWNYTLEERKQEIVAALDHYLEQTADLSDRQKLLLRDAIGHAYRGLFGLAAEDVYDLARDESEWAAPVAPDMVAGITRDMLQRKPLRSFGSLGYGLRSAIRKSDDR